MSEFFGISMTYIMLGLLAVLALAVGVVGWVLVRNRIMFLIGVRNIPRRRAQTVLIVLGLMLSTLIISAALSIGDTVDYSITNQAYDRLHNIDETVQTRIASTKPDAPADDEEQDPFAAFVSIIAARPIEEEKAAALVERFRALPDIDGAVSVLRGAVPVTNERAGQSEPIVILIGAPQSQLEGFDDIASVGGERLSLDSLGRDEIYVNKSAADELDIVKGDRISLYAQGRQEPERFTVKEIVRDRVLTGAAFGLTLGVVLPLDRAQELIGRDGEVDFIAVSNRGDVRGGIKRTDAAIAALDKQLAGTGLSATDTKRALVDQAAQVSSFMTTFFVILGLFSIASGMMLIFLIFVMLAAERKVEMGMSRAVGTKRAHLVQIFMSEGMAYNMAAAMVGCALGVLVSLIMVGIMARLFAEFDIGIKFNVTARSLVVSYSLGVVLTFITVVVSAWRISNLNIVSAIRDMPDPSTRPERPRGGHGWLRPFRYAGWLIFRPRTRAQWLRATGLVAGGVLVIVAGMGAAAVDVTALQVAGVLATIAGGIVAIVGALLLFRLGALCLLLGPPLMLLGVDVGQAGFYAGGASLLVFGVAMTLDLAGVPQRPLFSAAGIGLIVYWLLTAGGHIPPTLDGGPEMFFLSGLTMVTSCTFVLVFNADIILGGLTRVGSSFSRLIPAIRMAVAYPMANRFRTGMTIAMISLVVFALVMMSTINSNFDRVFSDDEALGGYPVVVTENPSNPISDPRALLGATGSDGAAAAANIAGVDPVGRANSQSGQARKAPKPDEKGDKFSAPPIYGMSEAFQKNNGLKLKARANGYESDEAVWQAIGRGEDVALVDAFSVGEAFGPDGGGLHFAEIKSSDKTFEPVGVEVRDASTGVTRTVQLIGVLSDRASVLYFGLFLPGEVFDSLYTRPDSTIHYVRLNDGASATATAKAIEKALLSQGVQADSQRKLIDDQQALSAGFLRVLQGFMGLGLFVGIAAVGVIAFRTVVERRQHIGMLRAIGYTRGQVATSFVMESMFTTLLGVLSGIGLGLLLANQLVLSKDFGVEVSSFYIPWLQISAVGLFAVVASLVMTIIPSRQASGVPIAQALRYE